MKKEKNAIAAEPKPEILTVAGKEYVVADLPKDLQELYRDMVESDRRQKGLLESLQQEKGARSYIDHMVVKRINEITATKPAEAAKNTPPKEQREKKP